MVLKGASMDLTFEDFVAEQPAETDDGTSLALYAYARGQHPPADALDHHVWQRAMRIADRGCGRALQLSERDRARVEATMLGLPFVESAQLPPPEKPDEEVEDDPDAAVGIVAALADIMGEPFTEADTNRIRDESAMEGIEAATVDRQRWAGASDRLHTWHREMLDKLAGQ